jgi:coat protein Gp5
MANVYQPWQVFTNRALRVLKNKLVFLKGCDRSNEYLFAKPGQKSGNVINVRYPARYVGRTGEGYSPEPFVQSSFPVVIRPLQGVDIDMPSTDWTLNIDKVEEDVLNPAMAQLVNNVEFDCMQMAYQGVANFVGTLNTAPTTAVNPLLAGAYLRNEAAPDDVTPRLLISPNTNASIVPGLSGLFNPQVKISDQFEKGLMAKKTLGWDWYETQNTRLHTIGPLGGTPTMSATAGQTGSSIVTMGWTAAAAKRLNKGDVIEIANVNAVNPMTRQVYGGLRHFVVTADVYSDGAGNATIPISPSIVPAPLAFATVDNTPAGSALISVFSVAAAGQAAIANTTSAQCLGYAKEAFTFAGVSQHVPKGSTEMAYEATDPDTGIQLRFIRQYLGKDNLFINRFDVLYAFGVPYPQLAVRLQST